MANCRKDTSIALLDGGSALIKNIKFTTDRKEIHVFQLGNLTVECTNDINSNDFLGVKIVDNHLVFTDAISGLNTDISSDVSDDPIITVTMNGGVMNIGIDDTEMEYTSVSQLNVRYDAASDSVKFQV